MSRWNGEKVKAVFGGRGFYIALALCLLAAGTIGYITLFSADSPVKEPDPVIEIKPTPVTPVPAAPTKPVIQSEPVEVPVQEAETDELINKVYDGSADKLFAALLGRKKLSAEQIERLRQIVGELE